MSVINFREAKRTTATDGDGYARTYNQRQDIAPQVLQLFDFASTYLETVKADRFVQNMVSRANLYYTVAEIVYDHEITGQELAGLAIGAVGAAAGTALVAVFLPVFGLATGTAFSGVAMGIGSAVGAATLTSIGDFAFEVFSERVSISSGGEADGVPGNRDGTIGHGGFPSSTSNNDSDDSNQRDENEHGGGGSGGGRYEDPDITGPQPIILDLDGDGIEVSFAKFASFDWDEDGYREYTSWAAADDAFLVIDLDANGRIYAGGDGTIDQAREVAFALWGPEGATDLQALAEATDSRGRRIFDTNGDGFLTARDSVWNSLKVWQDIDQDGETDPGELKSLAAWGITRINLSYDNRTAFSQSSDDVNVLGNVLHGSASYTRNGEVVVGGVGDVSLAHDEDGWRRLETSGGFIVDLEAGEDFAFKEIQEGDSANLYLRNQSLSGVFGDGRNNVLDAYFHLSPALMDGGAGGDRIVGSVLNDRLRGGPGSDWIYGGFGDDLLVFDADDWFVHGGFGFDVAMAEGTEGVTVPDANAVGLDVIFGTQSNDLLHGSSTPHNLGWGWHNSAVALFGLGGSDNLRGAFSGDLLSGGEGNDRLDGFLGDDVLVGGAGDDWADGGGGDDILFGGEGRDNLNDHSGDNVMFGGSGNDRLFDGGTGDSVLDGGDGHDILTVSGGDNVLIGGSGWDRLYGSTGDDLFNGGEGSDSFYTRGGDDLVLAGDGNDVVFVNSRNGSSPIASVEAQGGAGNDSFYFFDSYGRHFVFGGSGLDTVYLYGARRNYDVWSLRNDENGNGLNEFLVASKNGRLVLYVQDVEHLRFVSDAHSTYLSRTAYWAGLGDHSDTFVLAAYEGGAETEIVRDSVTGAFTVRDGAGSATVQGSIFSDTMYLGGGADTASLGVGADSASGGPGRDVVNGQDGRDLLYGDGGNDTLNGEGDADRIWGGSGSDNIRGGAGDDHIEGQGGADNLHGGEGDDTVRGGAGADRIRGGYGNDWLAGNEGNDTLRGGAGRDSIRGGAGADRLIGAADDDHMWGDGDGDRIYGNYGNDFLDGGFGHDYLDGGHGDDHVWGGYEKDWIIGGGGNDTLVGGEGDDRLEGGDGDDMLNGSRGNDELIGGGGIDEFLFDHSGFRGVDVIRDFEIGVDRIRIYRTWYSRLNISEGDRGAEVVFGQGSKIILEGVDSDEIDAGSFVFGRAVTSSHYGRSGELEYSLYNRDWDSWMDHLVFEGSFDGRGNDGVQRLSGGDSESVLIPNLRDVVRLESIHLPEAGLELQISDADLSVLADGNGDGSPDAGYTLSIQGDSNDGVSLGGGTVAAGGYRYREGEWYVEYKSSAGTVFVDADVAVSYF